MIKMMNKHIVRYLSRIGKVGGKKSRRQLSSDEARLMVRVREARKLFKKYYAQCFWSYDINYKIEKSDIPWVGDQLMKNGDRKLWSLGVKLCR